MHLFPFDSIYKQWRNKLFPCLWDNLHISHSKNNRTYCFRRYEVSSLAIFIFFVVIINQWIKIAACNAVQVDIITLFYINSIFFNISAWLIDRALFGWSCLQISAWFVSNWSRNLIFKIGLQIAIFERAAANDAVLPLLQNVRIANLHFLNCDFLKTPKKSRKTGQSDWFINPTTSRKFFSFIILFYLILAIKSTSSHSVCRFVILIEPMNHW